MKKYIGKKEVQATPAMRINGLIYLMEEPMPRTFGKREEGYKAINEDGLHCWFPKAVFEKAYKVADTFKDRLVIEKEDLEEKLLKLREFINSEKFRVIVTDVYQRKLLIRQEKCMSKYLGILNKRIEALA